MHQLNAKEAEARQEQTKLEEELLLMKKSTAAERERFSALEKEIEQKELDLQELSQTKERYAKKARHGVFGRFFSTWGSTIDKGAEHFGFTILVDCLD